MREEDLSFGQEKVMGVGSGPQGESSEVEILLL